VVACHAAATAFAQSSLPVRKRVLGAEPAATGIAGAIGKPTEGAIMGKVARTAVTVEEYIERRVESAAGRHVERHYRRVHWAPQAEPTAAVQVLQTAAPLLRALAIAAAPVVGRMALRALAPRLRAALPTPQRPRLRGLPLLALPAPRRRIAED
jgi:hypothetical protein